MITTSNKNRKYGVLLSYANTIAQIVVNLLYVPLLLSCMGASEYGLYQLIGSVIAYMAIMNSTFSAGVTRFYCKYYSESNTEMMETTLAVSRKIYKYISYIAIVVGILVAVLVRQIYSQQLSSFQLAESSLMLAVLVVNLIITMHNTISIAIINANERFVFLKCTSLFTTLCQPLLVVLLLQIYPNALCVSCAQLLMNSICAVIQHYYSRKVLGARVAMHNKANKLYHELMSFSGSIFLVLVADQVFWKTNQLILGYLFGTVYVAIYAIGAQIYMAYTSIGTAISSVFMPRISDMLFGDHDQKAVSALFTSVGRISLYPLLLVLFGFIIYGREFIALWAGVVYQDAYFIAILIMIPVTVDLMQNIGLTIMQVMNKYAFRGKLFICMAITNIILVIYIAPIYGGIGAAATTGICLLISNGLIMNIYYAKVIKLEIVDFWRNAIRVFAPLFIYAIAVFCFHYFVSFRLSWSGLIIEIIIFCFMYAAVAYRFAMNNYERKLTRSMLRMKTVS